MSKLINKKTPKQFFVGDREILRDIKVTSDAKSLYFVLSSLAESCENVCPSHLWLAKEIGYDTEAKEARTIHRFVSKKLNELVAIKAIKIIKNIGYTNDYEIYDYPILHSVQKSTGGLYKKVQSTPDKKVQGGVAKNVHIEIREEKKEDKNKDIDIKNRKNKTNINNKKSFLIKELREINNKAINQYIDTLDLTESGPFLAYKKNTSQVWSIEKAKAQIQIIKEKINLWIENSPKSKLSENPNGKARFAQFASNSELGWIYENNNNFAKNNKIVDIEAETPSYVTTIQSIPIKTN
jgi:hypothetical protein